MKKSIWFWFSFQRLLQHHILLVYVLIIICSCGLGLWLTSESNYASAAGVVKVTTKETALSSLTTYNCQRRFNDEFNFPIGTNLPVPMSIFHKGNSVVMVFSVQNFVYGDENKEWQRNFTNERISDYGKWFRTYSWKIQFQGKSGGQVNETYCQPVNRGNRITSVLIVHCKVDHRETTQVFQPSYIGVGLGLGLGMWLGMAFELGMGLGLGLGFGLILF